MLLNWSFDRGRQEVSFRSLDHCHKLFWTADLNIADPTTSGFSLEVIGLVCESCLVGKVNLQIALLNTGDSSTVGFSWANSRRR